MDVVSEFVNIHPMERADGKSSLVVTGSLYKS